MLDGLILEMEEPLARQGRNSRKKALRLISRLYRANYKCLFSRLHPVIEQVKLFLQLHVLGVYALDIAPLFDYCRVTARTKASSCRRLGRSHSFTILFQHPLYFLGALLYPVLQFGRALFQALWHL